MRAHVCVCVCVQAARHVKLGIHVISSFNGGTHMRAFGLSEQWKGSSFAADNTVKDAPQYLSIDALTQPARTSSACHNTQAWATPLVRLGLLWHHQLQLLLPC